MAKRLTPALEAATRNAEVMAARWRDHKKVCHGCSVADSQSRPAEACDAGYRIWQDQTRAAHAEARLRAPRAGQEQLQLSGM